MPREWVNALREAFHEEGDPLIDAPVRVTVQKLSNGSLVIHNYNQDAVNLTIKFTETGKYIDGFTGDPFRSDGNEVNILMKSRSNIWLIAGN
jgi:hypothetical protein